MKINASLDEVRKLEAHLRGKPQFALMASRLKAKLEAAEQRKPDRLSLVELQELERAAAHVASLSAPPVKGILERAAVKLKALLERARDEEDDLEQEDSD